MNFELNHLGTVDTDHLKDYYTSSFSYQEVNVSIDLNFNNQSISSDIMEILKVKLLMLEKLISVSKRHLEIDFQRGDIVKEYIELFIENLSEDEVMSPSSAFSHIKPVRLGFYPEDKQEFTVIDFAIDQDITDYLLVVKLNEYDDVKEIVIES